MSVGDLEVAAKASETPYQPLTNNQFSKWVFKKGNTVFLLRAPRGQGVCHAGVHQHRRPRPHV